MEKVLEISDIGKIISIFGEFDKNINVIKKEFDVTVVSRDSMIKISGMDDNVLRAESVIMSLVKLLDSH